MGEERGEENIQRGESVARKYAVFGRGTLAVVSHILGRPPVRPTTVASANLSTSPECFTRSSWHFFLSLFVPLVRKRAYAILIKIKTFTIPRIFDKIFLLSRASSTDISSTELEIIMAESAVSNCNFFDNLISL